MSADRRLNVASAVLAGAIAVSLAGCDARSGRSTQGVPTEVASAQSVPLPQENPAPAASVGTVVDDSVLSAKLKSALIVDPTVKGIDVKVETRKGEVQLSGFVDDQSQIDRAMTIARNMEGVRSVDNKMTLKSGTASVGNVIDDGLVTARVKTALLADPRVKSIDIGVVTRKGEVQLSGFVDTQAQIEQAVSIARGVNGAQAIDNKMSVKK